MGQIPSGAPAPENFPARFGVVGGSADRLALPSRTESAVTSLLKADYETELPDVFGGFNGAMAEFQSWVDALVQAFGGKPSKLLELISDAANDIFQLPPWLSGVSDWVFGIAADFEGLLQAFSGNYSGDNEFIQGIQSVVTWLSGVIDPFRLSTLPFWQLTEESVNMVAESDFRALETIDGGQSGYYWDGDHGRTGDGSAAVDGDGEDHSLSAVAPIRVSEGQKLRCAVWVSWQWVTGTATDGAQLALDTFLDGTPVSTEVVGSLSPYGTQPVWQKIEGDWTVPPGVDQVAPRFVTETADGTVRYDDVSIHMVSLMKMSWTENLVKRWEELAGLFGIVDTDLDGDIDIEDVWNTLWDTILKPLEWITAPLQDVIDRIINAFENLGQLIDFNLPFTGILDAVFGIFDTGLVANNRISEVEVKLRQLASSANAVNEGFDGGSAGNLGGSWTQNYSGAGAGSFGRDGRGNAVWKASGAGNRTCIARYNVNDFDVDSGVITVQLASSPQSYVFDDAYTYLCWRMNSAGNTYVRLRIGYDSVRLQKVVGGSTSNIGGAWSGNPAGGNVFEVFYGESGGTNLGHYVVKRNGVTILNETDGSPTYGPGYRYVGCGMETGNRLVFTQNIPAGLAVFTAVEVL